LTALPGAQAQVQAGTMRGLAVTTRERWVNLPDVPTFSEQGFPDVTLETEHFLLAPAATPPALLERYTKAALAVMAQDDIKSRVVAARLFADRRRPRRGAGADRDDGAVLQTAHRQRQDSADRVIISSPPASGEAMALSFIPPFRQPRFPDLMMPIAV